MDSPKEIMFETLEVAYQNQQSGAYMTLNGEYKEPSDLAEEYERAIAEVPSPLSPSPTEERSRSRSSSSSSSSSSSHAEEQQKEEAEVWIKEEEREEIRTELTWVRRSSEVELDVGRSSRRSSSSSSSSSSASEKNEAEVVTPIFTLFTKVWRTGVGDIVDILHEDAVKILQPLN